MERIPMEWVDKIFDYMTSFFEETWTIPLEKPGRLSIAKKQWHTGLIGLTKDEIKKGLAICKCMAKNAQQPPNVIEFYYYSKGVRLPPAPAKKIDAPVNKELAKNSIEELKRLSRGYI